MKLALQLHLIPGDSPSDKAKWAKDHGVEGIELAAFGNNVEAMRQQADAVIPHLPVCSVCGNCGPDGKAHFHFLNPDKALRRVSIDGSAAILKFCGEVKAVGQIVPPIFGGPAVPDLSPLMSPLEIEDKLMVEALKELGPIAAEAGTLFMLEPLNRYEQHYLKQQADGKRVMDLAKAAGVSGGVGLLSDFFHMHIEETNTPHAFQDAAGYTTHIHLADNTRLQPGSGDIDFVASFKVLKQTGFDGYMAFECGIEGGSADEKRQTIAKSLDYLRDCISRA